MKKQYTENIGLILILSFILFSCNSQTSNFSKGEKNSTTNTSNLDLADGIVFFSDDNGLTWENKSNGLPDKVTLGIGALAVSNNSLGIATKEYGIYVFDLQKQTWINIPTAKEVIGNNLGAIVFFKNQIFVGTQLNGVYSTIDKGNNWINIKNGLVNLTIRKLAIIDEKLYAGTNTGLYSLNDETNTWELEYGNNALQVNGITHFGEQIYIGTNQGIFTNTNKQNEWQKMLENYSLHNINSDDKNIYAMTYNELFLSKDEDNTWQSMQKGLPKDLYTFDIIKNNNFVFAGQWDGVYRKNTDINIWQSYSSGLPSNLSITNIKSFKNFIIASGNERGLRNGMTTDK